MSREVNPRKAAVIGCGFVGSATAFTLMQSRLFSELVLLDVNMEKADGEAKDIAHGIPFAGQMKIYAGTYDDAADAAIIIITAGRRGLTWCRRIRQFIRVSSRRL